MFRLRCLPLKKNGTYVDKDVGIEESDDISTAKSTEPKKAKKTRWWHRLSKWFKKRRQGSKVKDQEICPGTPEVSRETTEKNKSDKTDSDGNKMDENKTDMETETDKTDKNDSDETNESKTNESETDERDEKDTDERDEKETDEEETDERNEKETDERDEKDTDERDEEETDEEETDERNEKDTDERDEKETDDSETNESKMDVRDEKESDERDETERDESETDETETDESETDESKSDQSETGKNETDKSDKNKTNKDKNDSKKDSFPSSRFGAPREKVEIYSLIGGQPDLLKKDLSHCGFPYNTMTEQEIIEALMVETFYSNRRSHLGFDVCAKTSTTSTSEFGFPNIGQSCYMNSCLQSLLTLKNFIRDISCQERAWNSNPNAQLVRRFLAIRDAHTSTDINRKRLLLRSFKEAVSVQAPEFSNGQQKDAHEFLTMVLNQMWSLSSQLQDTAACTGRRFNCPVERHLTFKMDTTRTCQRCGAQSKRQEVYTNLSLDLVPGGSVEDMLQKYLKETKLEYRCQCGGNTSGQRLAFKTLPRILVLHVKRFRFTFPYRMEKVHDPIVLLRDLIVSSEEDAACYSLVSVINHLGFTGEAGHYISDGVHPDNQDGPSDRWLTFNDSVVTETTGMSVCEQRRTTAYILFYKKHD